MKVTKAPILEFFTKILDTDLESNERHLIPSGENLGREKGGCKARNQKGEGVVEKNVPKDPVGTAGGNTNLV